MLMISLFLMENQETHYSSLLLAGERACLDLDTHLPDRTKAVSLKKKTLFSKQILFHFLSGYSTVENVSLRQTVNCYSPSVNTKRVMQPDSTEERYELSMDNADIDTTYKLK